MSRQPEPPDGSHSIQPEQPGRGIGWAAPCVVFGAGACVMVVELLGTRVIAPVFGVGLFTWSALLAVTLCALAIGYYYGGVLADRVARAGLLGRVVALAGVVLGIVPLLDASVLEGCESLGAELGPTVAAALLFGPTLTTLGMVGPIVTRAVNHDVARTGHSVGKVYALSTAGSLVGTLLTAHWLIPSFATDSILFGTAASLVALGLLASGGAVRTPLALGAIVLAFWFNPKGNLPEGFAVLDEAHSVLGKLQVIDDRARGVRFLRSDHSIIGAAHVASSEPAFAFVHVLEAGALFRPGATTALQIGLGIGSLPTALDKRGFKVDVVEIDPEVVRMAREHFGYRPSGQVHIEDARTFLRRGSERYDYVIHDTFTGGGTPEHLLSVEPSPPESVYV